MLQNLLFGSADKIKNPTKSKNTENTSNKDIVDEQLNACIKLITNELINQNIVRHCFANGDELVLMKKEEGQYVLGYVLKQDIAHTPSLLDYVMLGAEYFSPNLLNLAVLSFLHRRIRDPGQPSIDGLRFNI